jgi:hypothetical protein
MIISAPPALQEDAKMQDNPAAGSVRSDLLERLKALDPNTASDSLAELAYRRAREALEKALEEARAIRLQAVADARATREREMTALLASMRNLRVAADAQAQQVLREAELHAERSRDETAAESRTLIEQANTEAAAIRNEARAIHEDALAIRAAAEAKQAEVEALEANFNHAVEAIARRLGITETPPHGWWAHLVRDRD